LITDIPAFKKNNGPLLYFVGRGAPQKEYILLQPLQKNASFKNGYSFSHSARPFATSNGITIPQLLWYYK